MKISLLFFVIATLLSCKNHDTTTQIADKSISEELKGDTTSMDYDLEVYDFDAFEKFLNKNDGKVYIINFWATWCAPCVKELPYFEQINTEYSNKNVEVILVSLDFPHLYQKKLVPFIKERHLKSKVIALDDVDMNTWIPKVDEAWSGSIPATIIYKNTKKKFYERSFSYDELKHELNQF